MLSGDKKHAFLHDWSRWFFRMSMSVQASITGNQCREKVFWANDDALVEKNINFVGRVDEPNYYTCPMYRHFSTPFILFLLTCQISFAQKNTSDNRNILLGNIIPDESYCDQPYVVIADDGAWVCAMTTGNGNEGNSGQHIVTQRSLDKGKTWTDFCAVEPASGPEASYATMIKAPSGRIFIFYNYNTENRRTVIGDNPPYKDGVVTRVDCQGDYVFKFSDDNGKTWTADRYVIPVREFEIDRKNPYKGQVRYFWNVGKPFAYGHSAYVPLIKVQSVGVGFYMYNEGVLLKSTNLFDVSNPAKAKWETLPDGEHGIKAPHGGPIAAEHSFVTLSDGSFFCTFRTIDGYPGCSYSRDQGHNWSEPDYLSYADGRKVKHPRAANFVWKCSNGNYLYWYHNQGGQSIANDPNRRSTAYSDRNPVWILGGVEVDSPDGKTIKWSQPEILLYDNDPLIRISYPDLVECEGEFYITETQKDVARIHAIDKRLLDGLWAQVGASAGPCTLPAPAMSWKNHGAASFPTTAKHPTLDEFYSSMPKSLDGRGVNHANGFSLECVFSLNSSEPGQVLADARNTKGQGYVLRTSENNSLELELSDGQTRTVWRSDDETVATNGKNHFVFTVDAGPHIISVISNGKFNDGGDSRQFGWGRFSPYLRSARGAKEVVLGKSLNGTIEHFNVYRQPLTTSEAIELYRDKKAQAKHQ